MWNFPDWEPFLLLIAAFALSAFFTGAARRLSHALGMVDRPDGVRKTQRRPIPLLGGVAVFLSFVTILLACQFFLPVKGPLAQGQLAGTAHFWAMLTSASLFCGIGLIDDRLTLRARNKLALQVLAVIPFIFWGKTINAVSLLGGEWDVGSVGGILTVVWLIGCVNAVNLVDGLDGLAGSIAAIMSGTLALFALSTNNPAMAAIAIVLTGSIAGFLIHNWPPAKIYLGDAGSMTIGFLVGVLSLETSMKMTTSFTLAVPMVLLSVPIFDTLIAIVRRKLEGRSIGHADRRHIHHRLQDSGLTKSQALVAIVSLCLLMAAASLVSVYLQTDVIAVGVCLAILTTLIVGRVFGYDETVQLFRHVRAVTSLLLASPKLFQTRLVLARFGQNESVSPEEMWRSICQQSAEAGCSNLDASVVHDPTGEQIANTAWADDARSERSSAMWQFGYSLGNGQEQRLTISATGHSRNEGMDPQMEDCFRLLEAFCHAWRESPAEFLNFLNQKSPAAGQNTIWGQHSNDVLDERESDSPLVRKAA